MPGSHCGCAWPRLTPAVRQTLIIMGPGVLGAGVTQLNLLISTALASLLPGGSVSYLYYADRLNQLPLGVVGIAVATAILPPLSRQVRGGDAAGAATTQNRGRRTGDAADAARGGRARHSGAADSRGAVRARRVRPGRSRRHRHGTRRLCRRLPGVCIGQGVGPRVLRAAGHRDPGQDRGRGHGDQSGADLRV